MSTDFFEVFESSASFNPELTRLISILYEADYDNGIYIKPSDFIAGMKLTTEERIEKTYRGIQRKRSITELQLNTFSVVPYMIVFQNFTCGNNYVSPVSFLNNCEISKPLKYVLNESANFSVSLAANCVHCHKIAPGMTQYYNVHFHPEEMKDYFYQIKFLTEAETITVPVLALRSRAILTFPDESILPKTPLKLETFYQMNVKNIGQMKGQITLRTERPFYVDPENATIDPNETISIKITFKPQEVNYFKENLIISTDTGEKFAVQLLGEAYELNIRLEMDQITFGDTYMSFKNYKLFRIYNDNDLNIMFKWTKYSSFQEVEEIEKMSRGFERIRNYDLARNRKLLQYKVVDKHGHVVINDKILEDLLIELDDDDKNIFKFSHPNFEIFPLTGEIPANSYKEITLLFMPDKEKVYKTIAFCDALGLDQRLLLTMQGQGLGPQIVLCSDSINVNRIYVRKEHHYDINLNNTGYFAGTVSWIPTETNFGGNIQCCPSRLTIKGNRIKTIMMKFCSERDGKFVEEVKFLIEESGKELIIAFMGEIFSPHLDFDQKSINFGVVSFAVPVTYEIKLINTAKIAVEYELSVPEDGDEPSFSIFDDMNDEFSPIPSKNPRNFIIEPASGYVGSTSTKIVKVTLVSNKIGSFSTFIQNRMWKSENHVKTLPIEFNAQIPQITVSPSELKLNHCFVDIIYKRTISVSNKSNLFGLFYLLPTENDKTDNQVECKSSITRGIIKPQSTIDLELTINTNRIGENILTLEGGVFGDCPTTLCEIICWGQGSVLEVEPEEINFGKVNLLEETKKDFLITNDSPVPSLVKFQLSKKTVFTAEPSEITLSANSTEKVSVWAYLTIPKVYKETMEIVPENGQVVVVPVIAIGTGCMILSEPKLWPEINIGTLYTHTKVNFAVSFTNMGNKPHKILWSRNKFLKSLKEDPLMRLQSAFNFEPNAFELFPEDTIDVVLVGYSEKPCVIAEDFYCHAVIPNVKTKKIISSFILNATFLSPILELSTHSISFFMNILSTGVQSSLLETVCLKNPTPLPININLMSSEPFYLIFDGAIVYETQLRIESEKSLEIKIGFKPILSHKTCYSKSGEIRLKYKDYPKNDVINLTGAVNYPNLKLNTKIVNFKCYSLYGNQCKDVLVKNISPLPLSYSITLELISEEEKNKDNDEFDVDCTKEEISYSRDSDLVSEITIEKFSVKNTKTLEKFSLEIKPYEEGEEILLQDIDLVQVTKPLEIEKVKFPIAFMIYPNYFHVLIKETIYDPEYLEEGVKIPEKNQESMDKIQTLLYPLVVDFNKNNAFYNVLKILPDNDKLGEDEGEKQKQNSILEDVIDVVPRRGFLGPFESAIVSISFHPDSEVEIFAKLIFHVEGGTSEQLSIYGVCDRVKYCFSTCSIDFNRTPFYDLRQENIWLKNSGNVDINFCTNSDMEVSNSLPLKIGYCSTSPSSGTLEPDDSVELKITYYPGIPGEFKEEIVFHMNYEPPTSISLHGFGVFPQVYLNLPRPSLLRKNPVLLYTAVASLTKEYLKMVMDIGNIYNFSENIKLEETMSKVDKKMLIKEGWHVISLLDFLPSVMDIDLATERIILHKYLQHNRYILRKPIKKGSFWNCPIPPYDIDFGFVVRETDVNRTIKIFNYGPVESNVKLFTGKKKEMEESGLNVQFKKSLLKPGKSTQFHVIFSPTENLFPYTNIDFVNSIYLQVNYGIKIPIVIRAIVVLPILTVYSSKLNFDNVECGKCVMKTFTIKNCGYVTTIWKATIRNNQNKKDAWIESYWKTPNFYLGNIEGKLEPNESCQIRIYFEPQWAGNILAKLIINIKQNPKKLEISLKGNGIEPKIAVMESCIVFDACEPYHPKYEKIFTIKNISPFPVEFSFTDFDLTIDEDEAVTNLIIDYYETDRILIPLLKAGEKLPANFYQIYQNLYSCVRDEFFVKQTKKSIGQFSARSHKSSRSTRKSELNSNLTLSISEKPSTATYDTIMNKSFNEIQMLMKTLLKQKLQDKTISKYIQEDPIERAFLNANPQIAKDSKDMKEGVLFIFHGAPYNSSVKIAAAIGLKLNFLVYSMDNLIIEAIIDSDTLSAISILDTINKAFNEVASQSDFFEIENYDEYEALEKKVELIVNGKEKRKSPEDVAKKSDKSLSSKSSKREKNDTLLEIPVNLLKTILKKKTDKIKSPFIVESLNSQFITKPLLALDTLLAAVGNYRYLQMIILSQTFQQKKESMNAEKQDQEESIRKENEEKIEKLMNLSPDEAENLSAEDMEFYRREILLPRKIKSMEKKQKLKQRILLKKISRADSKHNKSQKVVQAEKPKIEKPVQDKISKSTVKQSISKSSGKNTKISKEENQSKEKLIIPGDKDVKLLYDIFEDNLIDILHLCETWNRKECQITKPFPDKGKQKVQAQKVLKATKSNKNQFSKSTASIIEVDVKEIKIENLTEDQIKMHRETGIPVWLFDNVDSKNNNNLNIDKFLKHTPQVQEAVTYLNESKYPNLEESTIAMTVLHKKSEVRSRNVSNVFILGNEIDKEDVSSSVLSGSGRKEGTVSSRTSSETSRRRRKRMSKKESTIVKSGLSAVSLRSKCLSKNDISQLNLRPNLNLRNVLKPNEEVRFKVTFYPKTVGEYIDQYELETINWPCKFVLECKGKCSIPEIDMNPLQLFPKVIKRRNEKNKFLPCVFVEKLNVFDFGYILNPPAHITEDRKAFSKEAIITLANKSFVPCVIIFSQKFNNEVYQFEEPCLTVEPKCSSFLNIKAFPKKKQSNDDELMISIKNNPKVESIRMTCSEANLQFGLNPKELNFYHTVVGTKDVLTVSLNNQSEVLVNWLVSKFGKTQDHFNITSISGFVPACCIKHIDVEYSPEKEEIVPKDTIEIKVFDENYQWSKHLYKGTIDISAEAVEVPLVYNFVINFGNVKYEEPVNEDLEILNKGKFNVDVIVLDYIDIKEKEDENRENRSVRKMFTAITRVGTAVPDKPFQIKIKFVPSRTKAFKNVPVYTVQFIDPLSKKVVEKSEIIVSGKGIPSSFKFCPNKETDFGHQLVGTQKIQTITLTNRGIFEFEYRCLSLKKFLEELDQQRRERDKPIPVPGKKQNEKLAEKIKKNESVSNASSPQKPKPKTKMESGPFAISPSTGTIQPKESVTIEITSTPNQLGVEKQAVLFMITNSRSKYDKGIPYILKTNSCAPKIDLNNVRNMLKEVTIANSKTDIPCGQNIIEQNVYFQRENELRFKLCCLNRTVSIRLYIENQGTVPGYISSNLADEIDTPFDIKPQYLAIQPYSIDYVNVSFTPKSIKEFKTNLEIENEIFVDSDNKQAKILLCGECVIPEIKITNPPQTEDSYVLYFEPTLIGDEVEQSFSFKNIGIIECQVVLDLFEDQCEVFHMFPHENTVKYLNFWDEELKEPSRHTNFVKLKPNEEATFIVSYKAKEGGNFSSGIKLYLIDNPFEDFLILLCADTYKDGIVFEDLKAFKAECIKFSSLSVVGSKKMNSKPTLPLRSYEIDFTNTPINTLRIEKFKIKNLSNTDTFRFDFSGSDYIQFKPTVGHLKPLAVKNVIVTFDTKEPVYVDKEKVICQIRKISYKKPQHEVLSWDDRQTFVLYQAEEERRIRSRSSSISSSRDRSIRSPRSSVERRHRSLLRSRLDKFERKEPEVEYDPNYNIQAFIFVDINACFAEYKWKVDKSNVTMPKTNVFEKSTYQFTIKNISEIDLNIEWYFVEVGKTSSEDRPLSAIFTSCKTKSDTGRPKSCLEKPSGTLLLQKLHQPFHLYGGENFLYGSPTSTTSLFGTSTTSSACDSTCQCGLKDMPFSLSPFYNACIKPEETQQFEIVFAPKKVSEYEIKLVSKIPNLDYTMKPPKINLKAESVLPLCHFDLEPSNYFKRRGNRHFVCDDIADEYTRVFEIEAIGLNVPVKKSFAILNPTEEKFVYEWMPHGDPKELSVFHIHNPKGCVAEGYSINIIVTFVPTEARIFEKFYKFRIEKHNLTTTFLFVGIAREPSVHFVNTHLILKPAISGFKTYEYASLKNCENFPIAYRFVKKSFCSEAGQECVQVEHFNGTIPPNEEKSIKISFCTTRIGDTTFNLKCKIEKMKDPLSLFVVASCYQVEPVINYIIKGREKQTLEANKVNNFEFKDLSINNEEVATFKILNKGKIAFYYKWIIKGEIDNRLKFDISPKEGFIEVDSDKETVMQFTPLKKVLINKTVIVLQIPLGPSYIIHFSGYVPDLSFKFSFRHHNFGKCLLQNGDTLYYNKILEFTNTGDSKIILENRSGRVDFLTVDLKTDFVLPKKTKKILIFFHPKKEKTYKTKIVFAVNSQLDYLSITGEGVTIKLELVDVAQRFINFGSPLVGKIVKRKIKVVNKSKTDIPILLDIKDRLPFFNKLPTKLLPDFERKTEENKQIEIKPKEKKEKKEKQKEKKEEKLPEPKELGISKSRTGKSTGKSMHKVKAKSRASKLRINVKKDVVKKKQSVDLALKRLVRQYVSMTPNKFTKLNPNHHLEFIVTFAPKERMNDFVEQLAYQVQDVVENISTIKGSAIIANFELDKDIISFGNVVIKCSKEVKATLSNLGDTDGKFLWKFDRSTQKDFTITPTSGYLAKGTIEIFTISFSPTRINCAFKRKLTCTIDGFKKPLEIILTGNCIKMPSPSKIIQFKCPVRETDTKYHKIENNTQNTWIIKPEVNGEFFHVTNSLVIEPNSSTECEILYKPLRMCKDTSFHNGYVFLVFPDSRSEVVGLRGTANNPLPANKIERIINCKTYHTEILHVENWLGESQQFKVITADYTEVGTDSKTGQSRTKFTQTRSMKFSAATSLYKCVGNDMVNVVANDTVEYAWTIFAINDGNLQLKVTFLNEKTKEYIYYIISLSVERAIELERIQLSTCVRTPLIHKLKFENVVGSEVVFNVKDDGSYLEYEKMFAVKPYSEHFLEIEFNPMVIGTREVHLEVTCNELGSYPYTLILTGLPPIPEPPLYFTTPLGQIVEEKINLPNLSNLVANYDVEIEHPDLFSTEANEVVVMPEREEEVFINFDPCKLGEIQSKITFTSKFAGIFVYPLIGRGGMPKPTGPYRVRPGGIVTINFRNPFLEKKPFRFLCEPPIFTVKKYEDYIEGKERYPIVVSFQVSSNASRSTASSNESSLDQKLMVSSGKLIVYCLDRDLRNIKWIFYLQTDVQ